ncbi:MAG: prenyltransferase [Candidatus Omnitrophica bacterium]|nr:prenyltransferase [Candidatus Omnitrophota bacterium]
MAKLKHWLLLSRVPFLSVTVLPYILGALLAGYIAGKFSWPVFLLGLSGALLVQLAAHYGGEVYDIKEDRLSITLEKNFFSGGSQVVVENIIAPKKVKILIGVVVFLALALGLILQFYFNTGKWTLLLGISGIICGFFYSKPPLRWVSRGIGEIFIAYAFGWLAVNAGFYIQAARFAILPTLVSLPIACAVVNIILINEYPDYPADIQSGKLNLLARIGKAKGAFLYAFLVGCSAVTFFLALASGFPAISGIFYFPVFVLALILAGRMLKGEYQDRQKLEKMCGLTIIVNLGTSLSCILGLLARRA